MNAAYIGIRALYLTLPLGLAVSCRGTDQTTAQGSEGLVPTFNDLTPAEEYGPVPQAVPPSDYVQVEEDSYFLFPLEPADQMADDGFVDELGDEDAISDLSDETGAVGATGERADCDLVVESASPGAVADPCMTSYDFMRSLGMRDLQIDAVRRRATLR